jgi:hypothetical protein
MVTGEGVFADRTPQVYPSGRPRIFVNSPSPGLADTAEELGLHLAERPEDATAREILEDIEAELAIRKAKL